MTTCIRIILLICIFMVTIKSQPTPRKEDYKIRMAELRKEIDSISWEIGYLEKEAYKLGKDTLGDEIEKLFKLLHEKYDECRSFKPPDNVLYYNSPNIYIEAKTIYAVNCGEQNIFIIDDRKSEIEKNFTFSPHSGNWEERETDKSTGNYKSIGSGGSKIERLYDEQGRLTSYTYITGNNRTLASEHYVWENGRLAKASIDDDKVMNFIYGTPCDSVRVEPTDRHVRSWVDFNPLPTYDKSFGLIPDESDPGYEDFKMRPYSFHASPKVLERQKARCEEYKKELLKKGGSK